MMLLSWAWWAQKLTGVMAQAVAIVALIAIVIGGLAWLRHDARLDERRAWETKLANARAQQLLLLQRKEREASAIGFRAEKNLLAELDASESIINGLEKKLAERQGICNPEGRPICYPVSVVKELNK